ncbi:11012_t:CDS:2 [Funneliformis caledonium]|uniref:11012_t:CDS:1 n=1 Tax=Funneliformis caledonium TaxID=1117310 RepID=A0A9N9G6G2_9GLOM|nr:11012_t:CDS:2 [Funneliformis caledonium]
MATLHLFFYASSKPALQDQEPILSGSLFTNNGTKWREPNEENEEINNSVFNTILEDYLIGGPQLRIALDKFADRYAAAKAKSIPRQKRKPSPTVFEDKENLDPQIISARKKKKTGKKDHNLSAHIAKNQRIEARTKATTAATIATATTNTTTNTTTAAVTVETTSKIRSNFQKTNTGNQHQPEPLQELQEQLLEVHEEPPSYERVIEDDTRAAAVVEYILEEESARKAA